MEHSNSVHAGGSVCIVMLLWVLAGWGAHTLGFLFVVLGRVEYTHKSTASLEYNEIIQEEGKERSGCPSKREFVTPFATTRLEVRLANARQSQLIPGRCLLRNGCFLLLQVLRQRSHACRELDLCRRDAYS